MVAEQQALPLLAIDYVTVLIHRQYVRGWKVEVHVTRVGDRPADSKWRAFPDLDQGEIGQVIIEEIESIGLGNPLIPADRLVAQEGGEDPFEGF